RDRTARGGPVAARVRPAGALRSRPAAMGPARTDRWHGPAGRRCLPRRRVRPPGRGPLVAGRGASPLRRLRPGSGDVARQRGAPRPAAVDQALARPFGARAPHVPPERMATHGPSVPGALVGRALGPPPAERLHRLVAVRRQPPSGGAATAFRGVPAAWSLRGAR